MEKTAQHNSRKQQSLPRTQTAGFSWGGLLLLGLGIGGALALVNSSEEEEGYLYPTPQGVFSWNLLSLTHSGDLDNKMYYDHNTVANTLSHKEYDEYYKTIHEAWRRVPSEAVSHYEENMKIFPNWSTLWNLGICRLRLGQLDLAEKIFEQFFETAPSQLIDKVKRYSVQGDMAKIVSKYIK